MTEKRIYTIKTIVTLEVNGLMHNVEIIQSVPARTETEAKEAAIQQAKGARITSVSPANTLSVWDIHTFERFPELTFCGCRFKENDIREIRVCREGKTVAFKTRTGHSDYTVGVWGNRPEEEFEKDIKALLSKGKQ